jgi:hypothetical protein
VACDFLSVTEYFRGIVSLKNIDWYSQYLMKTVYFHAQFSGLFLSTLGFYIGVSAGIDNEGPR